MRRLFEIHTWERGIIERDELGIGIGHQNRRVGGDQELGAARLHQGVHLREKDELTLRRKSGLRLVEQEKTFLEPALDDREKCLPMRAAVQRLAAIQRVGISRPTELRVSSACVEQGSEMGLELGSKEIAVTRPPAERRPEDVRKRASLRGRVVVPAGSLDDDPGAREELHIFVGSKAPWYEIADDLPRHEAYPPGPYPPPSRRTRDVSARG